MSKIDNIFVKIISDEAICKEYGINDPQKYQNIAQGLKSLNGYVVAIATVLQQIDKLVEEQKMDMRIRGIQGAVVLKEVPPNCTVVGVPGRIVKRDNVKVPRSDMDQVHLPDPIMEDITTLQMQNITIKEKLDEIEQQLTRKQGA